MKALGPPKLWVTTPKIDGCAFQWNYVSFTRLGANIRHTFTFTTFTATSTSTASPCVGNCKLPRPHCPSSKQWFTWKGFPDFLKEKGDYTKNVVKSLNEKQELTG